jgi:hypothetical protein
MSPERFKKNYKPSEAADVFAIGLILYELIFLEPYFKDLNEVMSHNDMSCKERIDYDMDHSVSCLNTAQKVFLTQLLLEMLNEDPLERISIRLLPNRLQTACYDHKTVTLKVKRNVHVETDNSRTCYNKAQLNDAVERIVQHNASKFLHQIFNIKKEIDETKKKLNQIVEDELVGEKEDKLKGEILNILPFTYKIRIYQFGLFNYLKTNETKALSMFRSINLSSKMGDEDERLGNIEFFKKTCLRIMNLIYSFNGTNKLDFANEYIQKILSEAFVINNLQKDLIKYNQCPAIYKMSEATSIMINKFCAGDCSDIEMSIGQWVTRDNFMSYIIPFEDLKAVNYLAGVVFRFNTDQVEIRKVYFEQIFKHRYQILVNINEYQMVFSENKLRQIDEEKNEKYDLVSEEPFAHYRVLDPKLIKKELNHEVRIIFQKIYAA